jgi:hypothetical protein
VGLLKTNRLSSENHRKAVTGHSFSNAAFAALSESAMIPNIDTIPLFLTFLASLPESLELEFD